jgi:hypothetical protein
VHAHNEVSEVQGSGRFVGMTEVSLAVKPTLRGSGGVYFASELWPCTFRRVLSILSFLSERGVTSDGLATPEET